MNEPTYIPIFRLREQEKGLLTSFKFGSYIYPYIEIFKKQPIAPRAPKEGEEPKPQKPFDKVYLPILDKVDCEKMFVDLPVHLHRAKKMYKPVLEFLVDVIEKRHERTNTILSLKSCKRQIIPIISSYARVKPELNTLILQEVDLRPSFGQIGFRTTSHTFNSDILQIEKVAKKDDFLFLDFEEYCLSNPEDMENIQFMIDRIKTFEKCNVVIINSPIHHKLTNSGLCQGEQIQEVNNCLIEKYREFGGDCFADYAGVKKDLVEEGGFISPGLIFYDAIGNAFFGYKGRKWKKEEKRHLGDIKGMILPELFRSEIIRHMRESHLEYLGSENMGWQLAKDMWDNVTPPRSQSKLKRISMEHYLHCIKTKILAGSFLN